jgi:outer membrane protein TolC
MMRSLAVGMLLLFARVMEAQSTDSVTLDQLQSAAIQNDPRGRTSELLAQQSRLRMQNLRAERLPSIAVNAQAQYQSTTFTLPITLPGVNFPTPKRDSYDAHVDAREQIIDPTLGARRNLERAQLGESQARVSTALYSLRQAVNDAYFNALQLQERERIERTAVTDLLAQLKVAEARVREGTALPSEAASLAAALITRRQSVDEIESSRRASLNILADLTGRNPGDSVVLAAGADSPVIARTAIEAITARPEYEQFKRAREVLDAQRSLASKKEMPRVSAFGRAGYGRPD